MGDERGRELDEDLKQWEADFEAAARRTLRTRFRYAFIRTYKPVLDDARYRSFDTMGGVSATGASEPAQLAGVWPPV
jgi:hypothetical protein